MAIPLLPELRNNLDETTVSIVNMHFNIYELLGLHNIQMSCSKQSPEYECDTNSHKMRHSYKCSHVASTTREHPYTGHTQLLCVAHGSSLRVTMRGNA